MDDPEDYVKSWNVAVAKFLTTGCLCHISINKCFEMVMATLIQLQSATTLTQEREDRTLQLLSFLIRAVHSGFCTNSIGKLCPNLEQICSVLKSCKVQLISALAKCAWPETCTNEEPSFVRNQCQKLLLLVLKFIPCPTSEICERCCPSLVRYMVQRISRPGGASTVISLLAEQPSTHLKLKATPSCANSLGKVLSNSISPGAHNEEIRSLTVIQLKQDWKKLCHLSEDIDFLNLWQQLVSIKSNLGVNSCRESIASTRALVVDVCSKEKKGLLWTKKASILNEVLCYGTTLALQSEIPDELCSIAQAIVKEVNKGNLQVQETTEDTSQFFIGQATCGARARGEAKEEVLSSLPSLRSFSLLLLKSVAILLRQATSCSSGEESDSSHYSRGCLCDEEVENIEKSMVGAMDNWLRWLSVKTADNVDDDSVSIFVSVFMDQDDMFVEAMLCLLDIFSSMTALCPQGLPHLHPLAIFECFMERCSWDPSVLVDFLISNETCFLLYFLRLLKFIVRRGPCSQKLFELLKEMQSSLEKLHKNKLFPYDIKPIVNLLKKVSK